MLKHQAVWLICDGNCTLLLNVNSEIVLIEGVPQITRKGAGNPCKSSPCHFAGLLSDVSMGGK